MKAWGSKKIIRREDLPEVALWQVDQFSGASVQRPHVLVPEPLDSEEPAIAPVELEAELPESVEPEVRQVPMVEPEELERLKSETRDAAYQSGYQDGRQQGQSDGETAGREAGYAAGFEAGQAQGRQVAGEEVARFMALSEQLGQEVAAYEARLAEPIRDIAIAVARQVLRTSLAVEPEKMLAVIREAINSLPELQGPLKLELHPDDIALVKSMLADDSTAAQWRFEAMPEMERGGARISHSTVELDLTLPNRWRRIVEALGSDEPWQIDDDSGN
ncbi:flagellar assembly protein FliH [Chitinimonas naiadis]